MRYRYDLHIHSCLSPCGADDMTPASIAGFAKLNGLDLAALTDHNSARNCCAFECAAREYGLASLCGLELTTSEDIHVLCLFETAAQAESCGYYVEQRLIRVDNRKDIFGGQYVVDVEDKVRGEVDYLLINATSISFDDAAAMAESFGGVAVPAHIDKDANSAVSTLGAIAPESGYAAYEFSKYERREMLTAAGLVPSGAFLINSDAHTLEGIGMRGSEILLDCSLEELPGKMIDYLKFGLQ